MTGNPHQPEAPAQSRGDLVTRTGFGFNVRPVTPADEGVLADFFHHVTPDDLRFRFLTTMKEVSHARLVDMTDVARIAQPVSLPQPWMTARLLPRRC